MDNPTAKPTKDEQSALASPSGLEIFYAGYVVVVVMVTSTMVVNVSVGACSSRLSAAPFCATAVSFAYPRTAML